MKELKSVWSTWSKICLTLGVSLLALYVILGLAVSFIYTAALGLNGVVWTIVGVGFYMHVRNNRRKLERLKREGVCYEAEIVRIAQNNNMIRIGSYISACAECRYINLKGKKCLVRSDSFLIGHLIGPVLSDGPRGEKLTAKVYVNKDDPQDYYVEVCEREIDSDYAYR